MLKEIALLGLDGIGKSTMSEALAARLKAEGHDVAITSWSRVVQNPPSDFAESCLADLFFMAFKGTYADARSKDMQARDLFPATSKEFLANKVSDELLKLDLVENSTWGIVAGAFSEISGNYFFRSLEVDQQVNQGKVVIQETFGYKHLVKELFLARELAKLNGDDHYLPLIEAMEIMSEEMFSSILAPQFGFVVDGDPELAFELRLKQSGVAGWTEDMQLACDRGPNSYIKMQQYSREKFLEYGEKHNWPVITVDRSGKEQNVKNAVEMIMSSI